MHTANKKGPVPPGPKLPMKTKDERNYRINWLY